MSSISKKIEGAWLESRRLGQRPTLPFFRAHPRGYISLFPACPVAERVCGSEEKPQVQRGGATGASAGANHTSVKQSREERDETPFVMLSAIGDPVHLLGLVSHPSPRPPPPFHLFAVSASTMVSINVFVWRHTHRLLPRWSRGDASRRRPCDWWSCEWTMTVDVFHWLIRLPSLRDDFPFVHKRMTLSNY